MAEQPESNPPEATGDETRLPGRTYALGLRKAYKGVRRVAYGFAGLGMVLAFAGQMLPKESQPTVVPVGFALILLGFLLLLVGYVLFLAIKLKESP